MSSYPYRPLHLPEETRILTISPGQYDESVVCSLTHMSLSSDTEPYEALSYCWGKSVSVSKPPDYSELITVAVSGTGVSESGEIEFRNLLDHPYYHSFYVRFGGSLPAGVILCDGIEMAVGGELHRAIKRLRSSDTPLRIWIDALCINQNDIPERNEHVKLMGSIYTRAAHVRIWLGEEIGIESEAVQVLEDAEQILTDAIDKAAQNSATSFNIQWHLVEDPRTPRLAWEVMERFFSRAWFRRVWIIQEIANSRQATVYIGRFVLGWEWLSLVVSTARYYKMDRILESDSVKAISMMRWLAGCKAEGQTVAIPLLDALEETRTFESTVTSDKIYGVLGLVDNSEDVVVDYALDARDVFKRLAVTFLTKRKSLDMLCHCVSPQKPSTLNLPSWVADWTAPGWVEPFRSRRLAAKAAGSTDVRLDIDEDADALNIWGKSIDKIVAVDEVKKIPTAQNPDDIGSWYVADAETNTDKINAAVEKAVDAKQRNMAREHYNRENAGASLANIFAIAFSGSSPTPEMRETLARTFMCNRTRENERPDASCSLGLDAFWASTSSEEGSAAAFQGMTDHERECHGLGEGDAEQYYNKITRAFETLTGAYTKWCHNRRFFKTASGHYGWGVDGIMVGDVVTVLYGGDYPFVLREQEDQRHRIVGDCYLHGFMDGEGVVDAFADMRFHIV